MKISACLIIKNEEKNLPSYIDGVKDIADEIIVADTGSTDNSVKILESLKRKFKLNLTVYNFKWINDFSAAKNFALSKATGDWIIFCDADEYFIENDRKKIRPLLKKIDPEKSIMGVIISLLNVDANNHNMIVSTNPQIKIFRNLKELRFKRAIHEYLEYTGDEGPISFFESDLTVFHTGYSSDVIKAKTERNKKIILESKDMADDFYLAVAYYENNDFIKAEEHLKKSVEDMKKKNASFLVEAYLLYINTLKKLNRPRSEIESLIDDGLKAVPNHPDFLTLRLTDSLMEANVEKTEELCAIILEKSKDETLRRKYLNKIDFELPYVHYALGICHQIRNQNDVALNEFLTALKSYRYRDYFLKNVLSLLEDDEKKAEKILRKYYDEKTDAEFLAKVFADRPRDNLYKTFCKDKNSIDYMLACQNPDATVKAIKKAATELTKPQQRENADESEIKEKINTLALCFLFLDLNDMLKAQNELKMLPHPYISVILRFWGEVMPTMEGEKEAYNALKTKANVYLPKNLREKYLELNL